MRKSFVLAGLLLLMTGLALAQEPYPKVETSPGFMYIRTPVSIGGFNESFNCAGGGGTIQYNVSSVLGLAFDGGGCRFFGNTIGLSDRITGNQFTFLGGPRFTFRNSSPFRPFFEANFGGDRISLSCNSNTSCSGFSYTKTAFALTAGGGFDIKITRRFALRPVQAEYLYTRFGNDCGLPVCSNNNNQNSFRLKSGIVMGWGMPAEVVAVSASCSASPASVDAGQPVSVNVTPSGFSPKRKLSYSYSTTGGKISGTTPSASVDTSGLSAGSYTVGAKVVDDGSGKNQRSAGCQTSFVVIAKQPPTLSVSAYPSSVTAGGTSAITATGSSPDNRPLTYSCTATAGSLTGTGPSYTLDTTGASGSIDVNCTVTDDRNLSASASTSVAIVAPPAPPAPAPAPVPPSASKFGDIEFKHDLKRPTRVDNEAKGELDRYADALAAAPDSKGVIVGFATTQEDATKKGKNFAAERAVNTKEYLTKEKGIDPARLEPRTGAGDDQRADLWVVPAGATFPETDTTTVNEEAVKAVPRVAPAAKKKAPKAE